MILLFVRSASTTDHEFGSVADNLLFNPVGIINSRVIANTKTGHACLSVRTDRALARKWYCTFCEDTDLR